MENRDWSGKRVYPPGNPFEKSDTPDSHETFPSTDWWWKSIAQGANDLSGGTAVTPGFMDAHPESVERFAEFMYGGAGNFLKEVFGTVPSKLIQGKDLKHHEIPFWSKVYDETGYQSNQDRYYEALSRVEEARKEREGARDDTTDRELHEVEREYAPELSVQGLAERTEKRIQALDDRIEKARKAKGYTTKGRNRRIRELRERKEEAMLEFSRAYHNAQRLRR